VTNAFQNFFHKWQVAHIEDGLCQLDMSEVSLTISSLEACLAGLPWPDDA